MKTVTLVRHGNAKNNLLGEMDFDRTLTIKGREEATKMAGKIWGMQIPIDLFICSAAARTTETCELFANQYGYSLENIIADKILYNASPETIFLVLQALPDEVNSVVLVGHNPAIGNCASLMHPNMGHVEMPTCAVISVAYDTASWSNFMGVAEKKLLYYGVP
jgi:phosphohistidine phosphatase